MLWFDGAHMVSDISVNDLHKNAKQMNIPKKYFYNSDKFPHYDILGKHKWKINKNCSPKYIVKICKKLIYRMLKKESCSALAYR